MSERNITRSVGVKLVPCGELTEYFQKADDLLDQLSAKYR